MDGPCSTSHKYSRSSVARTLMARYHGYFELILESLGKKTYLQIWDIFFFILKMVCCVYSLESPRRGDSNENIQYIFMLKKIEKVSTLSLLTWFYD